MRRSSSKTTGASRSRASASPPPQARNKRVISLAWAGVMSASVPRIIHRKTLPEIILNTVVVVPSLARFPRRRQEGTNENHDDGGDGGGGGDECPGKAS